MVLWSVLFISVVTLYRPVEQFVSRSLAESEGGRHRAWERDQGGRDDPGRARDGFVSSRWPYAGPIEDGLLSGDADLYRILILAAPAYAVSFFARGYLAGTGRFGLYGSMLLLESCSRFAMAAVVTVGLLSGGSVISFGILLAPLMSLTVVPLVAFGRSDPALGRRLEIDLIGEEPESPVAAGTSLGRGSAFVGSAFLVMLSEQALLNAGVLIVAADPDAAAAGLLFNIMLIARAPQVLFGSVTTSLLPSLSRHWVEPRSRRGSGLRARGRGTVIRCGVFDAGPDRRRRRDRARA